MDAIGGGKGLSLKARSATVGLTAASPDSEENRILRSKLPDRIKLSNQERRVLVRHGKGRGPRIKELISHFLVFIHVGSRRIWVSPCTANLNAFCIVHETQLDYILRTTMDWYNFRRGHSARDHLPPVREEEAPPVSVDFRREKIVCDSELGGHLKSYRSAA